MKAAGLDPAYTKSGISDGKTTELILTKPSDDLSGLADSCRRASEVAVEARLFMKRHGATKLFCESAMMNAAQAHHLYEVGLLMRTIADEIGLENLSLVTPTALKKFLTGHGNSPKEHKKCRKITRFGKEGPPCVACGAKELHGVEFDKDAGKDMLHSWGLAAYGNQVLLGKIIHTEPARRGSGASKVKHRAAVAKKKEKLAKAATDSKSSKAAGSRSAGKASVPNARVSKR